MTREVLDASGRLARPLAAGAIAAGLAAAWLLAWLLGGAGSVAPHWFYLPVLVAAARFGCAGAAVAGVTAGLLAGPALPLDVDDGTAQTPGDWGTRLAFFVLVGVVVSLIVGHTRDCVAKEVRILRMERNLRLALERGQFVVHYQPIVSLTDGRVVGVEALARWQHPERGLVGPLEFIGAAEETGVIIELGEQVLRDACSQAVRWRQRILGTSSFSVAVNVSTVELGHPDWAETVWRVLDETGLDPAWLHLEITESALAGDLDATAERLRAMQARGIRIAIDDFGTGSSSLAYLRRFPLDVVKIDRSFVTCLGTPSREQLVTEAVIRLAHEIDLETVGEGIEDVLQVVHLRTLGCDLGQGYYFAKPLPARAIEPMLSELTPFAGHLGRDLSRVLRRGGYGRPP